MNTLEKPVTQYATMFADDLQFMAGDAYAHKNIETGGTLYGLWSHSGRPVIMLAAPAGPGACRETAHFAVDPKHVTWMNKEIQKMFGIQYIGNEHSHHKLTKGPFGGSLDHPSGGDAGQIHRMAARCNIPRMIQIILTYEEGMVSDAGSAESVTCSKIRVSTFIYTEASKGGLYTRIPIKVLHYPNPIRTALAESNILHVPGCEHFEEFPLERIVYDKLESADELNDLNESAAAILVSQLDELPDEIASSAEVFTDKDLILISLALSNGCRVFVMYNVEKAIPEIHSVHFVHPQTKASVDITGDVLIDNFVTLALIYKRSENKVKNDKEKCIF